METRHHALGEVFGRDLLGLRPFPRLGRWGAGERALGFQVESIISRSNALIVGCPGHKGEMVKPLQRGLSPPLIAFRPCELVSPGNNVRYRAGIPESAHRRTSNRPAHASRKQCPIEIAFAKRARISPYGGSRGCLAPPTSHLHGVHRSPAFLSLKLPRHSVPAGTRGGSPKKAVPIKPNQ